MKGWLRWWTVAIPVILMTAALHHLWQEKQLRLAQDTAALKKATGIVFTTKVPMRAIGEDYYDEERSTVSAAGEVAGFLDKITLRRKHPCKCAHVTKMVFQTPAALIPVSFCSHCFDVMTADGVRQYRMPAEFYQEFKRLSQDRDRWQPVWEF